MKINLTDVVFYLSTLGSAGALFAKVAVNLISATTANWIIVVSTIVSFLAFAFYEKINGTLPPPTPPAA